MIDVELTFYESYQFIKLYDILRYMDMPFTPKQMRELDISMQKLKELSKKEEMTLKEKLNLTELYKDLEEIPEFIKKKVG